jgi:hypothetical protein
MPVSVVLSPFVGVGGQLFDDNGTPLAGGKIYVYLGGTSTLTDSYTSSAGDAAHTNPIILDAAGRVPSGQVWLPDAVNNYKFILTDANDVLIGTYDDVIPCSCAS